MSSEITLSSSPVLSGFSTDAKTKEIRLGDTFQETFYEILSSLSSLIDRKDEGKEEMLEWLKIVMLYNVPQGKQLRGRMVVQTYQQLADNPSDEDLRLARILGWIVEILQACCLVADDIMDNSVSRRGRPCWHLVNDKGNIAFNDALMLEHFAYQLLQKHFSKMDIYSELHDHLHNITFKTILGEALDTRIAKKPDFQGFKSSTYETIVAYKTAYYTVHLPVALGMTLAGISMSDPKNRQLWKEVEEITIQMGSLFQIQDDYFDCFADEKTLGKFGTDIQEGKCTWLFVTAREYCNENEFEYLKDNYGSKDSAKVAAVKKLYSDLGLPKMFIEFQENIRLKIEKFIEQLDHVQLKVTFTAFMKSIYKRKF